MQTRGVAINLIWEYKMLVNMGDNDWTNWATVEWATQNINFEI